MPHIEIPDALYQKAEDKIDEHGFNSVSEAVRYTLRRWIEDQ